MDRILVIDQNRAMRHSLKERLEHEGYAVDILESYDYSIPIPRNSIYSTIICDDNTIFAAHKNKTTTALEVNIIVLSAQSDNMKMVSDLIKSGVYSVISRNPLDMNKLREDITAVTSISEGKAAMLIKKRVYKANREIVGNSKEIERVRWMINKVAPLGARVLIEGANGTGKELVAHQLHANSLRFNMPFIEVNCAAIPSELIESELFGHEKGSFTSAIKSRKGKFEQADGGTLFLDEIGDMSPSAQAKVLRALQESKISRVGSDKDVLVDVRIVAATNKNLMEEIEKGNFREDLYHRLSPVVIEVPSLNQRVGDIPILAEYFMLKLSKEYSMNAKTFEPKALDALCKKIWSGNIRELRNVIERLVIFSNDVVTEEDVRQFSNGRGLM